MPKTNRVTAVQQAETLRKNVENIEVESDKGEALHITTSIGVATYTGDVFTRPGQLLKAADQAVYAAKEAGRNAVRAFAPKQSAA